MLIARPDRTAAILAGGTLAALLLVLVPGCSVDASFELDLSGEQTTIDSLLVDQAPTADVEVSVNQHGRHVEITMPTAPDSLAEMNPTAPPDTAKIIAKAVARTLKRSCEKFDRIQTLEVGFSNDTVLWTSSIKLDKEALQTLGS